MIPSTKETLTSCLASTRLLFQLDRLELCRQYDLQHLAAVGIVEHLVNDALRLQPGVAGIHGVDAVPFDLGFDHALEHVDHLEFALMGVLLRDDLGIALADKADHMGERHAAGGVLDAEVAIMRVGPKSIGLEGVGAQMACYEFVLAARLRRIRL